MRKTIGTFALLVALASLSACGGGKKDPNALTDEDNRQLNNAAEMLDASPDGLAADQNVVLGNGEEGTPQDSIEEAPANGAGNAVDTGAATTNAH